MEHQVESLAPPSSKRTQRRNWPSRRNLERLLGSSSAPPPDPRLLLLHFALHSLKGVSIQHMANLLVDVPYAVFCKGLPFEPDDS